MDLTAARLLLVDDEPDNLAVLSRRLALMGYTAVTTVLDGPRALAAIAAERFDAMFLDIMMPGMSGVQVLEQLRLDGRLEAMPVIVISASSEVATVARCLELGAEDYLSKPFNPVLLRARLRSVLEKRALRAQVRQQLARLEAELDEARTQQLSMVCTVFPDALGPVGASVHATMLPAREVGGDLYDVFALGEDALCIAVGDASDKGMAAALFMARTRSLLRAGTLHLHRTEGGPPAPAAVMALLNEELCKDNPGCMFLTLLLCILDLRSGRLAFANAGHQQPYLLRGGVVTALDQAFAPEPPLGVLDGIAHSGDAFPMQPGDGLVLLTDGLSDMLDPHGRSYGADRTEAALAEVADAPPQRITAHLVTGAFAFGNGAPQTDDVTLLALRLASGDRVAA